MNLSGHLLEYLGEARARISELEAELAREEKQAEQIIGMRDATIARLEAENAAARELLDKVRDETETRQATQAEARLAAVLALRMYREVSPEDPTFSHSADYVAGYDRAIEQARAAATSESAGHDKDQQHDQDEHQDPAQAVATVIHAAGLPAGDGDHP